MNLNVVRGCWYRTTARDTCWHPQKNIVFHAVGSSIRVVDVKTGGCIATLSCSPSDRFDFVLACSSHPIVVGVTRGDHAYIFSTVDYSLQNVMLSSKSDGEGHSFAAVCISAVHPFLFYSRHGSKMIHMLDLTGQRAVSKLDGKKPVSSLTCHSSKPILASGHVDGSVRLWDYQLGTCRVSEEYNSIAQTNARLSPSPGGISCLALHPTQEFLLAGSPVGLVVAYRASGRSLVVTTARVLNATRGSSDIGYLTSLEFHPTEEFLFSTFSGGKVQSWNLSTSDESKIMLNRSVDVTPVEYVQLLKAAYRTLVPTFVVPPQIPEFVLRKVCLHPRLNMVNFVVELVEEASSSQSKTHDILHPLFCVASSNSFLVPSVPVASYLPVSAGAISKTASPEEQQDVFYVKRGQLLSFSPLSGENVMVKHIPEVGPGVHVARVDANGSSHVLVLVERAELVSVKPGPTKQLAPPGSDKAMKKTQYYMKAHVIAKSGLTIESKDVRDASFVGKEYQTLALLNQDGMSISLLDPKTGKGFVASGWDFAVSRVFPTCPTKDGGEGVLYFSTVQSALLYSYPPTSDRPYHPDPMIVLWARKREVVEKVQWQVIGPNKDAFAFVFTSERLFIVDHLLRSIAAVDAPVCSALWCDSVVLFTRRFSGTVEFLCLDGTLGVLASTDDEDVVLCAVDSSRLWYVAHSVAGTHVKSLAVWPLEAVAAAYLSMGLLDHFTNLITSLDCTRLSPDFVQRLVHEGHVDQFVRICASSKWLRDLLRSKGMMNDELVASVNAMAETIPQRAQPDEVEGWLPRKEDAFKDVSTLSYLMSSMVEREDVPLTQSNNVNPNNAGDDSRRLKKPDGFNPIRVKAFHLPLINTSTFSSRMGPDPGLLSEVKVSPLRRPAPDAALPQIPDTPAPVPADVVQHDDEDEVSEASAESGPPSPMIHRSSTKTAEDILARALGPITPPKPNSIEESGFSVVIDDEEVNDGVLVERSERFLDECVSLLELGMPAEAIGQASESMKCLASTTDPEAYKDRAKRCAAYKVLLLTMLRKQKAQEEDPSSGKFCLFSTLSACVPLVDPEYRNDVLVNAISDNLKARNFTIASQLIEMFNSLYPSENTRFEADLAHCQGKGDEQEWCSQITSLSNVLFCVETGHIIRPVSVRFYTCSYCNSTVLANVVDDGSMCSICGVGKNV